MVILVFTIVITTVIKHCFGKNAIFHRTSKLSTRIRNLIDDAINSDEQIEQLQTPIITPKETKYCQHCGAKTPDGADLYEYCGK